MALNEHWKPDAIRELADSIAAAVFEDLERTMREGTKDCVPVMPLLENQRPFVMAALTTASSRVLQAIGLDTEVTPETKCGDCAAPLNGQAFVVWTIRGTPVPLCLECSKIRGRK